VPDFLLLSYALLWLLVVVLAVTVIVLIRQTGELYLLAAGLRGIAGDGLDDGTLAPDIPLRTSGGQLTSVRALLPEGGVFIFATEQCKVCARLVPEMAGRQLGVRTVIAYDQVAGSHSRGEESGLLQVVELTDAEAASRSYRVRVTPFAFVLDAENVVMSHGLVNSADQVEYHAAKLPGVRASPAGGIPA
jgi:hypothetical protein